MNKTVLEFLNTLPNGTNVEIHLTIGTTSWRTDPEVNNFLVGAVGRRGIERTSEVIGANGEKIIHIFPMRRG